MSLTEEEERKMYDDVLKSAWTLDQVKERLEKGDDTLDDHAKRLSTLEGDQKLLRGKLGFIVLGMSVCFTATLHAIGWIASHFWK
jgi:hypothetical protein